MPDEPNKKMDEMLRTYAEERRKAADHPLHPATRNMLQGEVARVFRPAGVSLPWWRRMRAFWPQIAFGASLCLVLGIAVLSLREPTPTEESASEKGMKSLEPSAGDLLTGEAPPNTDLSKQAAAAPAIVSDENGADATMIQPERKAGRAPNVEPGVRREQAQTRSLPAPQKAFIEAAPKPAQPSSQFSPRSPAELQAADSSSDPSEVSLWMKKDAATASTTANDQSGAKEAASLYSVQASKIPRSAALRGNVAAPESSRAVNLTNLGAARRLDFSQVTNANVYAGAPIVTTSTVLNFFQVEQMGLNVRFLDQDGSIYLGALEPTNAMPVLASSAATKIDQSVIDNSAAYYFRVQGTNRTLGRDMVVTGQYFTQTNNAPSALDTFAIAPDAKQTQPRHLIIGNATIGSTNQVPVRAVSNAQ